MYYYGTQPHPHPGHPDLRRCTVRRVVGGFVVVTAELAEKLRPYDLFLDKAGQVIYQDIRNRRRPLRELGPYELQREVIQFPS